MRIKNRNVENFISTQFACNCLETCGWLDWTIDPPFIFGALAVAECILGGRQFSDRRGLSVLFVLTLLLAVWRPRTGSLSCLQKVPKETSLRLKG